MIAPARWCISHSAATSAAGPFLANNEPVRMHDFAQAFARLANRRLRVWRVPAAAAGLLVGHPLADYVQGNLAFSNIRLRGIGFQFRYPTLEQGIGEFLRSAS